MLFHPKFKKGVLEFGYLKGNLWLKIFYHSYHNKVAFSRNGEAEYIIDHPDKFSILSKIDYRYQIDDKFEFIIYYPEDDVYFRWIQNKNPLYEDESDSKKADGFELKQNNAEGFEFGGLVKSTKKADPTINSLLDGNPGSDNWYFAIGMYDDSQSGWLSSGIPSYQNTKVCQEVSLWIRLPFPMPLLKSCHFNHKTNLFFTPTLFVSIFLSSQ